MSGQIRRSVKAGRVRRRSLMGFWEIMSSWKPVDFIAVGTMFVCGSLIALGHNSVVTAVMLAVSAYYFGHERVQ